MEINGGDTEMAYKLVAIDLDDTLLDDRLRISATNQEQIRLAIKQGIIVTIATGRMFRSANQIAQSLLLNFPLIAYNGALIKNLVDGKVLGHEPLPLPLAREIINSIEEMGFSLNCYVDDNLYVKQLNPEVEQYLNTANVSATPVGSLASFLKTPPTKLLAIGQEGELDQLSIELNRIYGGEISLTKSKPYYLEILKRGVSKGSALQFLCQSLGIRRNQVIAIGDSYNDLEMVDFAGLGVIMGNARDELKAKADYIAPSNLEDGVAHVLKRFVLRGN
jgi:Cof subfamily protein (haloacid dehalogenase superfamily)